MRHGESVWNRENRFTGWVDVDLTDKGIAEAREAGRIHRTRRLQSSFEPPGSRCVGTAIGQAD